MTVEAGELVVRIVAKPGANLSSELRRSVTGPVSAAAATNDRTLSGYSKRALGYGRSLGLAFGGAAVVGGITKTLNLAKNFDLTVRQIGVQTDQSGAKLKELSDLALKMGQDTVFSAQDAGNAMLELAKGGLTAAQIKAGALDTAMTLAAAGGLELSESAAAVVNGMGAFSLSAGGARRVAIALAGAANASSADVRDMTQALSQASAQANATGMSIEETSAALAIFANNGVKGSDAGTSLKTMLQNLIPTTATQRDLMDQLNLSFVDSHGNFVGMEQIAGRLRKSMDGLSQAQRVQAMRTLFGSDASRAALFLYKAGAKGVREATKETSNAATVQKMANTAMEGAAGAWENFTGSVETAAIRIGTKALPYLTELLNWGSDAIAGADKWGPALEDSFGGVLDAAKALWPVIREGAELVGDLAGFFADLPGPIQGMIVQAGIAALVLPRLTAGVTSVTSAVGLNIARLQQFRAELTYTATRAQATAAVMSRMAGAARAAAGIGGLVALTQAAGETDQSLRFLETTAGGALLGFSMGGPVGAAIGAGAGALYGLATATSESAVQMVDAKGAARDLANSLDQVSGSATAATRSMVLDQMLKRMGDSAPIVRGALDDLGLSMRDMVGYATGEHAATVRLNDAIRQNINSRNATSKAAAWQLKLQRDMLDGDREEYRAAQRRVQQLGTWKDALRAMPKAVRVALKQEGYSPNMRQIKALAKQYDLTPRQVRTIVRLTGAGKVQTDAKRTREELEKIGQAKGRPNKWLSDLTGALSDGKRIADRGGKNTKESLEHPVTGARANLSLFTGSIRTGVGPAKQAATTGGTQVGNNLQAGVLSGFSGTQSALVAQARAAVLAAVAAAKSAGKIKSPSQVMRDQVGKPLAQGAAVGIADNAPLMATAARNAVRGAVNAAEHELLGSRKLGQYVALHLVDGMVGSADKVRDAAAKLADLVGDAYDARSDARDKRRSKLQGVLHGKGNDLEKQRAKRELAALKAQDARDKQRERALRKLINDQRDASLKLAKVWDKNHAKLQDARAAVRDLMQQQAEYAKSVASAMVAAANITADMPEGVATTVQSITERMRTQVEQAKAFAANIATLIADGLDQDYIDQLVQAGVEAGGLEAAQLAGATPEQIAELNDLMDQLQSTGSTLGQQTSDYLYGAGIREAQSFVKQLEREEGRIERMMRRQARAFARELRDAMDALKPGKGNKGQHGPAASPVNRVVVDGSGGSVTNINATVNNPAPEPASQSVATRLRRLQQTGALLPTVGAASA